VDSLREQDVDRIFQKMIRNSFVSFTNKCYLQHGDDGPAAPGPERERRERPLSVRPAQRDAPLFRGPYCERIPRLLRTVPLAGGSALPGVQENMDV
jgi:hypothetical protein